MQAFLQPNCGPTVYLSSRHSSDQTSNYQGQPMDEQASAGVLLILVYLRLHSKPYYRLHSYRDNAHLITLPQTYLPMPEEPSHLLYTSHQRFSYAGQLDKISRRNSQARPSRELTKRGGGGSRPNTTCQRYPNTRPLTASSSDISINHA